MYHHGERAFVEIILTLLKRYIWSHLFTVKHELEGLFIPLLLSNFSKTVPSYVQPPSRKLPQMSFDFAPKSNRRQNDTFSKSVEIKKYSGAATAYTAPQLLLKSSYLLKESFCWPFDSCPKSKHICENFHKDHICRITYEKVHIADCEHDEDGIWSLIPKVVGGRTPQFGFASSI